MTDQAAIVRLLADAGIGPVDRISPWEDHVGSTCRLHRIEAAGRRMVGKIAVGVERHRRAAREIEVLRALGSRWRELTPTLVASRVEPRHARCMLVLDHLDPVAPSEDIDVAQLETIFEGMSQAWRIESEEAESAGLSLPRWGRGERGEHPHRRRARRLERRSTVVLDRFPDRAEIHEPLLTEIAERFEIVAQRSPDRPLRLIHGDLHLDNIVLTRDGPRVLDWQTCSLGDPVHDVARLAIETDPGRSFESVMALCDLRPETRAETRIVARAIILVYAGFVTGLAGRPDLAEGTRDHRYVRRLLEPAGIAVSVAQALRTLDRE